MACGEPPRGVGQATILGALATPAAPAQVALPDGVDRESLARLLISCADAPGIIAAISRFLHARGANITDAHHHSTDPAGGRLFMRVEFHLPGVAHEADGLQAQFEEEVGRPLRLSWQLWPVAVRKRVAILVSRYDHCLLDLLWRRQSGELDAEIGMVASNHPDLRAPIEGLGLPYAHVPVPPDGKPEAEAELLSHLAGRFDLIVLARYMQILSAGFLERVGAPMINIHHSFLPAFAGADPYRRARERGVKIIGATAHYVTPELDAGPIIEQDVARVSHDDGVETLTRIGRDIERLVLSRAVRWHLEDRVLVDGDRTVVFR